MAQNEVQRYDSAAAEIDRLFLDAETLIEEWLEEAEQEAAAIVRRARADAAQQAAQMKVSASERIAAALREADAAASARRQAAADEAADLLAESRAQAERRLAAAEEEATRRLRQADADAAWRLRQAEADAAAVTARAEELEARAIAHAAAVQDDIGQLQRQLTELVHQASALLPALDAARHVELRPSGGGDVVDAELVDDESVARTLRGLGRLVRDGQGKASEPPLQRVEGPRRLGLGRLLGRR